MKQYHEMLQHILDNGEERQDRTGTGTIGVFGYQNRYDLSKGFPLVTTKRMPLRVIFEELIWFLKGSTNVRDLMDKNVHIWDADAYRWYSQKVRKMKNPEQEPRSFEDYVDCLEEGFLGEWAGDLGPIYGKQWRSWSQHGKQYSDYEEIDQIANVIRSILEDPFGRRHIVSAWNVADLDEMALPPCHLLFQFYVTNDGRLSCQLYQRSADAFLGVPFNIASYALLIHMIAELTGLKPGEFVHTFGDLHIYKNHIQQVKEQLSREPRPLPELRIVWEVSSLDEVLEVPSIDEFTWNEIMLIGYDPHPAIKGKVSVGK